MLPTSSSAAPGKVKGIAFTLTLFLLGKFAHIFSLFLASDFLHSRQLSLISYTFILLAGSGLVFVLLQKSLPQLLGPSKNQLRLLSRNSIYLFLSFLLYGYGLAACGPIRVILTEIITSDYVLNSLTQRKAVSNDYRKRGLMLIVFSAVLLLLTSETSIHDQLNLASRVQSSLSKVQTFIPRMNRDVSDATDGSIQLGVGGVQPLQAILTDQQRFDARRQRGPDGNLLIPVPMRRLLSESSSSEESHGLSLYLFTLDEGFLGMLVLFLSGFLSFLRNSFEKTHAKTFGGRKSFHAVSVCGAALLSLPFLLMNKMISLSSQAAITGNSHSLSFFGTVFTLVFLILFFVVLQFYIETIASKSLAHLQLLTRLNLIVSLLFASIVDALRNEQRLSFSTILAAGILFAGLHLLIKSDASRKDSSNSSNVLPVYDTDVIKHAQGMSSRELKLMLRQFMSDSTSQRIFGFLCINFMFMFVELLYGFWSNSLGLISDAGHMLFDCTALAIGLYASFISKIKANAKHTYGYTRYEILSGYVNGVFLLFIGYFVFVESVERLFTPADIESENLVVVSILGLIVNLVGLFFFHDHHGGHGHSHDHGHSHGSHGHSHESGVSNHNLFAIYLHILADTLGSVGVICSSLMVQYWGWTRADAICSIIISVLIIASVVPLIKSTSQMLLQRVPVHKQDEVYSILQSINSLTGVIGYSKPHFWSFSDTDIVCTIHVTCSAQVDSQLLLSQIQSIIKSSEAGINSVCISVEKEGPQLKHLQITSISNPSTQTLINAAI